MKPNFLDCPPRYTRASNIDVTPTDYACSLTRSRVHKRDRIVLVASTIAAAALAIILFIWR